MATVHWPEYWNGGRYRTLEQVMRHTAAHLPQAPALIEPSRTTSFGDLDRSTSQAANGLAALGVQPGDRVCYVGPNVRSFFEVIFGASKVGAIPMPLNSRLSVEELTAIIRDAEPVVVFIAPHLAEHGEAFSAIPGVRHVIDWSMLDEWLAQYPATDPGYERLLDDTAMLFYTSGTTGQPKGIELTARNIAVSVAGPMHFIDFAPGSVAYAPVPLFHVAGFGLALMAHLAGAAILLIQVEGTAALRSELIERSVTHAVMVPTVIRDLLNLPGTREIDWSTLRWILYGGAPMPESVLREAAEVIGCDFYQGYGLTETTGGFCLLGPDDHRPNAEAVRRLRSVGRPAPNAEVKIIDVHTGAVLPAGQHGEVCMRGEALMKGYWQRPDLTSQAIDTEGWLHTGDGGEFDDDGYLYLHDRIKDMIVSGGENVYPAEVESALLAHPGVAQVAVVGITSERWGETPVAVVVRAGEGSNAEPTQVSLTDADLAAELVAFTRARLARYKCPSAVYFADSLPFNANGKLLKHCVREWVSAKANGLTPES